MLPCWCNLSWRCYFCFDHLLGNDHQLEGLYLRNAGINLPNSGIISVGVDLNQLYTDIGGRGAAEGLASVFRAGFREFNRLAQQANVDADTVIEGTERSMRIALSRGGGAAQSYLPFLAALRR